MLEAPAITVQLAEMPDRALAWRWC